MARKTLKLLVDVGVGRSVEQWLAANGYDVRSVRDIDSRMSDEGILALAVSEGRMVITMDKDFGELVYASGQPHSGVLLLRLEDAPSEKKVSVVRSILSQYADDMQGRFCVFQQGRLRIKRHPTPSAR